MSITTKTVQLDLTTAYVAAPTNGGPGILVLHAWWGLNPFFKNVCNRLAENGFTALAPDLWQGKLAATVDEAKVLIENENNELMEQIVMSGLDRLIAEPARSKGRVGVVGFSMGAAYSLLASVNSSEHIAAVGLFYGSYTPDFSKSRAKYIAHFAEIDEWEPMDSINAMQSEMKNAGRELFLHFYPSTSHWFMESDRPEYEPKSAELAWKRTIDFFKREL